MESPREPYRDAPPVARDLAPAARMLLAAGADPNATCGAGGTAMEMASNSPEVLELLVRAGARPTTRLLREAVRRILGEPNE